MRTHLDLFSGIGGFALAAQRAGFTTIGFSEIKPYACKILANHWPDVPNHGDIRTMRGIPCDLITGGFPCQPFSLAGKRGGASDDRALWPEMLRVIAQSKPRWVLGENVPGIINMELDNLLSDMEGIGYSAWPIVIPACAVDARHRRDRVWIVAHSEHVRQPAGKVTESIGPRDDEAARAKRAQQLARSIGSERGHEALAHSDELQPRAGLKPAGNHQTRLRGKAGTPETFVADSDSANGRRAEQSHAPSKHTSRQKSGAPIAGGGQNVAKRSGQDRPCEWPVEPELGRVAHGIPNRSHRLKGLGNSIVPQIAEILLRQIMAATI